MGVETGIDLDAARRLSWDACLNVRDVGGYATADGGVTRWRALLRSDSLCRLTPEGQAALVAHGVRTIVDLRSPSELSAAPHPFAPPDGAGDAGDAAHAAPRPQDIGEGEGKVMPRYLSLPLFDEDDEDAGVALAGIDDPAAFYSGILDLFAGRVGAAIAAVADAPEGGVLVHCHIGKDRTGLVVALALALAGVPRATIAADYALSDAYLQPLYAEMLGPIEDQDERDALAAMLASRPETMLAALAHLDERHGGVEPYLRAAGVTGEQIARVRRRLRSDVGE